MQYNADIDLKAAFDRVCRERDEARLEVVKLKKLVRELQNQARPQRDGLQSEGGPREQGSRSPTDPLRAGPGHCAFGCPEGRPLVAQWTRPDGDVAYTCRECVWLAKRRGWTLEARLE